MVLCVVAGECVHVANLKYFSLIVGRAVADIIRTNVVIGRVSIVIHLEGTGITVANLKEGCEMKGSV
jgi:hypothetical protein